MKSRRPRIKSWERVQYLIGRHHTYNDIDGIDYQILVEADFLVNMYEDSLSKKAENTHMTVFLRLLPAGRYVRKYLELIELF